MIPALILALVGLLLGGDSPFLIPSMDKCVKQCVLDKEKKKEALDLMKATQKEHKSHSKQHKTFRKEFGKMIKSYETTKADFDKNITKIHQSQHNIQINERDLFIQLKQHIAQEEWECMQPIISKDIAKLNKNLVKTLTEFEKAFEKSIAKTNDVIVDTNKNKIAVNAIEDYKQILFAALNEIKEEINSDQFFLYQHEIGEDVVVRFQDKMNHQTQEILTSFATMHFILVECTTEQEWKKIHSSSLILSK